MLVQTGERNLSSEGIIAKSSFGLSQEDDAHLMHILRNSIYSDKILAVLREYSANAWDSHRQNGKAHVPIKVSLPTALHPTLIIRDYGSGLSQEDALLVYTKYGKSTKRGTDLAVGYLGIGSKSGFCYGDSFMVTSWHGGEKKVYLAVLDESDAGEMQLLHQEPCGDETGIEIQISVRSEHISLFQEKARKLFEHFDPRPQINLDLPAVPRASLKHGFLNFNHTGWVGIMGCIPYRLDIQQVQRQLEAKGLWESLQRLSGGLYFDMREVHFSASREELRYTETTKEALVNKFSLLFEAYIDHVLEGIKDPAIPQWEKRVKATNLANYLHVSVPQPFGNWAERKVTLWGSGKDNEPKTFVLLDAVFRATSEIRVADNTCLLFIDKDCRRISDYDLNSGDYVAKPLEGATEQEVKEELDLILSRAKAVGVPTALLSSRPLDYEPRYRRRGPSEPNLKHAVRSFKYKGEMGTDKLSDNWEITTWEPSDEDVFIILSHFRAVDESHAFLKLDQEFAQKFKVPFPEIYGYKTTATKPISAKDCKGRPYKEWRQDFYKGFLTPEVLQVAQDRAWATLFNPAGYNCTAASFANRILLYVGEEFGKKHTLTKLLQNVVAGTQRLATPGRQESISLLDTLAKNIKIPGPFAAHIALGDFYKRYPLIRRYGITCLEEYNKERVAEWFDYIKLVDQVGSRPAQEG